MKQVLGASQERAAGLPGRIDETVSIGERRRERLLDQHVGAGGEPLQRQLRVVYGRRRHHEEVGSGGKLLDADPSDCVGVLIVELAGETAGGDTTLGRDRDHAAPRGRCSERMDDRDRAGTGERDRRRRSIRAVAPGAASRASHAPDVTGDRTGPDLAGTVGRRRSRGRLDHDDVNTVV